MSEGLSLTQRERFSLIRASDFSRSEERCLRSNTSERQERDGGRIIAGSTRGEAQ